MFTAQNADAMGQMRKARKWRLKNGMKREKMKLEIRHTIQGIEYYSPYDKGLVAGLKSKIPQNERQPAYVNGKFSHWLVHNRHKKLLDDLSMVHFGNYPDVIGVPKPENTGPIVKLLRVKYIGAPKDRGGGNNLSFALDFDGNWNTVFSEDVLRDWFDCGIGGQTGKSNYETLYGLLVVSRNATDDEIKKGYRRMAKRFHPDVCKDDDADEMFRKVQDAYETLSNPMMRRKYDAGLTLTASLENQPDYGWQKNDNFYRPPLRCGLIMATGKEEVGRFVIEKIMKWEPIKRGYMELVTSFDKTTKSIVEEWI